MITGLLVALPWIVLSWYSTQYVQSTASQSPIDDADAATASGYLDGVANKACALVAGAMLFLGCGQAFQSQQKQGLVVIGSALSKLNASTASTAFVRACSIGIPIYAGLKVGGFLVAFALSLVSASGLPTISLSNAHEKFGQKKITLALLMTVVLFSYLGLNATLNPESFMGYVSLLVVVFLIRPPFAVDHSGSAPEIGLGLSTGRDSLSPKKLPKTSSSEDALVNVLSGLVLTVVTMIFWGFPSPSIADLLYFGATAISFAVSFLYTKPFALRSPHKFGHVAGIGAVALLCSPELNEDLFVPYIARSTLAAVSFLVARFDDRHMRLGPHSHNHHNHHHHPRSHSHSDPSKVTKIILHFCEPYPLLYTILKEKDSRRIFYFMTYVISLLVEYHTFG